MQLIEDTEEVTKFPSGAGSVMEGERMGKSLSLFAFSMRGMSLFRLSEQSSTHWVVYKQQTFLGL